ncbi:MAG: M23 family metallopeptidase [Clostridia bacterium]|nr:M23 family metallopeptidase [Clostridia bacterium]
MDIGQKPHSLVGGQFNNTYMTGNESGENRDSLFKSIYKVCYLTGGYTSLYTKRFFRGIKRMLTPAARFGQVVYERAVIDRWMRLKEEWKAAKGDVGIASARMKGAHGFKGKAIEAFKIVVDGATKHSSLTKKLFNIGAPIAALLILFLTISHYANLDFALRVDYNGEHLGFVANEGVYTSANDMVNERIISSGDVTLESTPTFTLAVADSGTKFSTDNDICDNILGMATGELEEAYGLCVNGETIGAIRSQGDITYILESYLNSYKLNVPGEVVEFTDLVEVVYGYYPASTIMEAETLRDTLMSTRDVTEYYTVVSGDTPSGIARKYGMKLSELRALNENLDDLMYPNRRVKVAVEEPIIGVKSVITSTYTRAIKHATKTVKDDTKYTTYKQLQTAGADGTEKITQQKIYIDGVLSETKIIKTEVLKEPKDEVYVVGTKVYTPPKPTPSKNNGKKNNGSNNSGSKNSGNKNSGNSNVTPGSSSSKGFTWPVPGYRSISSPFGRRWGKLHKGIDISSRGINGASIVAAASGRVVASRYGYNGGYGNYILIDHGNGIQTRYAHCSKLLVSAGARVSKGQVIAKVGSTGHSTGPHLHFEVRVNGTPKNPMNYL